MNNVGEDKLAHASAMPDVAALIEACEQAQNNTACNLEKIVLAENERYQIRDGKDDSGKLWQKNLADKSRAVRPYDGAPDTDAPVSDDFCELEVDLNLLALDQGVLGVSSGHLSLPTAAQAAELKAVAEYCRRATMEDMEDDAELAAQMTAILGVAVLNPGWLEKHELVERTLDLESFVNEVMQTFGPEDAQMLYTAILDPTLEAAATGAVRRLFPHIPAARARQIVRELRDKPETTFLDRQVVEKRPTLRTLIPGYNYFVLGSAGSIKQARGHLIIETFFQAELEAVAAENGWNEDFVKEAISKAGERSTLASGIDRKEERGETGADTKGIEIWTTMVLQYDAELGAAGIYCTTFSPHVKPDRDGTTTQHFARHYLLDYAHRRAPFLLCRREVTGPGMFDSRSVPDIMKPNANVIRNLQNAGLARAHLEVDPPRAMIGNGWTKMGDGGIAPGMMLQNLMPGTDVKDLGPARGNPQVGEAAIQRVEQTAHRLFATPDMEVHPARWQPRAMRKARRALTPHQQALTQMVVLCYQNFDEFELEAIIGHPPLLTLEDVLRHRVTLTFDPRGLDNDWRAESLATMTQLLTLDRGGLLDTGVMIRMIGNLYDPAMMAAMMRDPQSARAKLYEKVQNDVNGIIMGNPPPQVEMDATAGQQQQLAVEIIGKNRKYQRMIMADAEVAQNLDTYLKNLQHSDQETRVSPVQGRLGVTPMPERPVTRGNVAD